MPETDTYKQVYTCDDCTSWTDREVTLDELVKEWRWDVEVCDDGIPTFFFCPECK